MRILHLAVVSLLCCSGHSNVLLPPDGTALHCGGQSPDAFGNYSAFLGELTASSHDILKHLMSTSLYASVPGYLFVVDPVCVHGDYSDSEPAVLRRYNIKKGLWDTPPKKTVQNAPAIRAEACGWCHGGRLYVWTLGKTPGGFNQMCIQSVKLEGTDWGTWKVHYQRLAPAGQKHLQADCLGGQVAGLWQECAASMDPKTEKVYLFGGWNGDNYSFAYLPGNACPSSTSFL